MIIGQYILYKAHYLHKIFKIDSSSVRNLWDKNLIAIFTMPN